MINIFKLSLFLLCFACENNKDVFHKDYISQIFRTGNIESELSFLGSIKNEPSYNFSKIKIKNNLNSSSCNGVLNIPHLDILNDINEKYSAVFDKDYVIYFSEISSGKMRGKITNNVFHEDTEENLKSHTWYGKIIEFNACFDSVGKLKSLDIKRIHAG